MSNKPLGALTLAWRHFLFFEPKRIAGDTFDVPPHSDPCLLTQGTWSRANATTLHAIVSNTLVRAARAANASAIVAFDVKRQHAPTYQQRQRQDTQRLGSLRRPPHPKAVNDAVHTAVRVGCRRTRVPAVLYGHMYIPCVMRETAVCALGWRGVARGVCRGVSRQVCVALLLAVSSPAPPLSTHNHDNEALKRHHARQSL